MLGQGRGVTGALCPLTEYGCHPSIQHAQSRAWSILAFGHPGVARQPPCGTGNIPLLRARIESDHNGLRVSGTRSFAIPDRRLHFFGRCFRHSGWLFGFFFHSSTFFLSGDSPHRHRGIDNFLDHRTGHYPPYNSGARTRLHIRAPTQRNEAALRTGATVARPESRKSDAGQVGGMFSRRF